MLAQSAFCLLNYQSRRSSLNFLFIGREEEKGATPGRKHCVPQSMSRSAVGSLATRTPGTLQLPGWDVSTVHLPCELWSRLASEKGSG